LIRLERKRERERLWHGRHSWVMVVVVVVVVIPDLPHVTPLILPPLSPPTRRKKRAAGEWYHYQSPLT